MLDVFHIAKPQGCDIQNFYGSGASNTASRIWNKPRGVSHVYMMLIGAGGNPLTDSGNGYYYGGGSGAITVWYGAAQHVPDALKILVPVGTGSATTVNTMAGNALLTANFGVAITAGAAMAANQFAASGFFKSLAGQDGSDGGQVGASTSTFLSGGAVNGTTANYGYATTQYAATGAANHGYFQFQPIIVGVGGGGANGAGSNGGNGGIGCGGGVQYDFGVAGRGGPGFVLIASW